MPSMTLTVDTDKAGTVGKEGLAKKLAKPALPDNKPPQEKK